MPRAPYDPRLPLDGLTRRSLLIASGVAGVGALLAGCREVTAEQVLARGSTPAAEAGTPILVIVTLYGGNDGLGMLVPFADPAYHDARPGLAYAPESVIPLDEDFGLSPALPQLAAAWHDRHLAIVRGVGYPKPDRSHFRSMDIWQTASPERPVTSGWIGRWLDVMGGDPLLAVSVGEVLPPLAVGERASAAALRVRPGRATELRPTSAALAAAYARTDPADGPASRAVTEAYAALSRTSQVLDPVIAGAREDAEQDADTPATATGGAATSITGQLDLVARCIRAGVPTRVYAVSQSGYDSHAEEHSMQEHQLSALDGALHGFRTALAGHARERDVVILVHSEFGRRVRGNASEGTDHGTASCLLLLGTGVVPGFHGEQPSLTDLDDGDLKATTDFRCVYAEIAEKVLQVDPGRVVPQPQPTLGVLA